MDLLKMMFSLLVGVLMLRTRGVNAPHTMCERLNSLQYTICVSTSVGM